MNGTWKRSRSGAPIANLIDFDVGTIMQDLGQAEMSGDPSQFLMSVGRCAQQLNVMMKTAVNAINNNGNVLRTMVNDVYEIQKDKSGKGSGTHQKLLRSEMEELRTKLQAFDSQITATLLNLGQRVDVKFQELSQSEELIGNVLSRVIEGVREKFDAQSDLRTRFESVVEGLGGHARMLMEVQSELETLKEHLKKQPVTKEVHYVNPGDQKVFAEKDRPSEQTGGHDPAPRRTYVRLDSENYAGSYVRSDSEKYVNNPYGLHAGGSAGEGYAVSFRSTIWPV